MSTITWFSENKSHTTNFVALAITVFGYIIPKQYGDILVTAGLFALSGALTNWLAVHMLFEKIPLLYGSGIIPLRFEEFKIGIKSLILQQFFTEENISRFVTNALTVQDMQAKLHQQDFDKLYQNLIDAIIESPFGSMLTMIGGKQALAPIKEPIIKKLQLALPSIIEESLLPCSKQLNNHIEQIVLSRLNELTPEMVKQIIQNMIHKHLGWLVVWGGFFGGLIGLLVGLLS